MTFFNNYYFYITIYLIFSVGFTQYYKKATSKMKNAGSLTTLIELIAGIMVLISSPLFKFTLPKDIRVYLLLTLACIFYAISNRFNTTVKKNIEASTFSVLRQLSTVFMIITGFLFFKEEILINKMLGIIILLFSNILIFYQKNKFRINKYVLLGIVSNIAYTVALFLDVNISSKFNLSFYIAFTLLIPCIMTLLLERIRVGDIKKEYTDGDKKSIIITSISWWIMLIGQLRAYQLGEVSIVAPLCSVTALLNVIAGYIFLKERDNLTLKIIAGILVVVSIALLNV